MKIKHHISKNWSENQIKIMNELGVFPKKGFTSIQIDDDLYLKLKPHLSLWNIQSIAYPEFTKKELKDSLLSAKNSGYEHGYPMPSMDFGYLKLTYDLSDYCSKCGIGKKQKDSFYLKNIPPKGKKKIFSIGWIHDELFVEKDIYNEIFEPIGIKKRDVLNYKNKTVFNEIVQLIIPQTNESLKIKNNPIEKCTDCNKWKYTPMPSGFYPKYKNEKNQIFKSKEYFGSGASAFNRIFISKKLRDKLVGMKIEKEKWYIPTK